MRHCKYLKCATAVVLTAAFGLSSFAQSSDSKKESKPSDAEMMAMMMEMGKIGENHKLLAKCVGTWTYACKFWMDPDAPANESTGTSVTKEIMGGRYFLTEHNGKMQMPGPDGKMTDMDFKGMAIDGYDNAKKKFVSSWIDNMGTGIMIAEGSYDSAKKTLSYDSECEMMPGMKTKMRHVMTINDKDHHTFEMFENRDGKLVRTMEIKYTRKS